MMEDQESYEQFQMDYLDAMGLLNPPTKDYGRERGLNPIVTEQKQKLLEKLTQRISYRSPEVRYHDSREPFELLSIPRALLFEGSVHKKSHTSLVSHSSKRRLFLFNDALLMASSQTSNSILGFAPEKYMVHKIVYLDELCVVRSSPEMEENPCLFEVRTSKRPYQFFAETESDKRIWVEELEDAILCVKIAMSKVLNVGWRHELVIGTIYSAALDGNMDELKYHIEKLKQNGGSINKHDEDGMSALHLAAYNGHLEAVELLIENRANVDDLNVGLNSAMMIAASRGYDTVVISLLTHGADFMKRNLKDIDVLMMAVFYAANSRGLYNIIQALSSRGINLDMIDSSGSTALHKCVARKLTRPVELLVSAGANVNFECRDGLTPLQRACNSEHPDVETVQTLLNSGAYPNWKDTRNRTAFEIVLDAHSTRLESSKRMSTDDVNSMKKTLDLLGDFIQEAAPLLNELVRKGCKFPKERLNTLRDSIQQGILAAQQYWSVIDEPDCFVKFVDARGEIALVSRTWMDDSSSAYCLLCREPFTYSTRRHHCRVCGVLCCNQCSTKRLLIQPSKVFTTTPKTPVSPKSPKAASMSPDRKSLNKSKDRVCDGCFNRLIYECEIWNQDMVASRKELERQERIEKEKAMAEAHEKSLLLQESKDSHGHHHHNHHHHNNNNEDSSERSASARQHSTFREAKDALELRGQMLNETVEKSEQLADAANQYKLMTQKLLNQYK